MNNLRRIRMVTRAGAWIALSLGLASGCGSASQPTVAKQAAEASAEGAEVVTDTATAAGQKLEIISRSGKCVLRAIGSSAETTQRFQLAPKAPCHFLRLPGSDSPRSLKYADVNTEAVLVISGTPVSDETRSIWKLEPGLICGEESQGLLVRSGKVLITKAVRKGGVTCRDRGVDEKEYWAFAHDER